MRRDRQRSSSSVSVSLLVLPCNLGWSVTVPVPLGVSRLTCLSPLQWRHEFSSTNFSLEALLGTGLMDHLTMMLLFPFDLVWSTGFLHSGLLWLCPLLPCHHSSFRLLSGTGPWVPRVAVYCHLIGEWPSILTFLTCRAPGSLGPSGRTLGGILLRVGSGLPWTIQEGFLLPTFPGGTWLWLRRR